MRIVLLILALAVSMAARADNVELDPEIELYGPETVYGDRIQMEIDIPGRTNPGDLVIEQGSDAEFTEVVATHQAAHSLTEISLRDYPPGTHHFRARIMNRVSEPISVTVVDRGFGMEIGTAVVALGGAIAVGLLLLRLQRKNKV